MVGEVMLEALKQAAEFFVNGMKPEEMAKGAKEVAEVAAKVAEEAAKNAK